MNHADAVELANEFVEWLRDCCLRIEIVGSVKRADKDDVGDIELLLIADLTNKPKIEFGQKVIYKTRLEERLAQLVREGIFRQARKKADGDKLKRLAIVEYSDVEDFCIELFIVRAETWGIQNVIRTGPHEFSKRFVTNQAKDGLLPDNLEYIKGETKIIDRKTGEALSLPEEADALAVLGLGWIDPNQRRKYG